MTVPGYQTELASKLVCGAAIWAAGAGRRRAKMIVKAEDGDGPAYQEYGKTFAVRVNLIRRKICDVLFYWRRDGTLKNAQEGEWL